MLLRRLIVFFYFIDELEDFVTLKLDPDEVLKLKASHVFWGNWMSSEWVVEMRGNVIGCGVGGSIVAALNQKIPGLVELQGDWSD